ncbi:hypothetical protein AWE51_03595 [Aquimarina aggregata]|uniref:Ricin B lectin domain-containing protein n=1 Tax=Aquimarina aggregata TaxID=1642818 RepID=A0A162DM80_9FLAO|nr:RICIN domain-containing protein [Aquimarina aggregata]KZS42538.1 hypothetical protein AWE51_03595 [Aquimarina aggregata]
MIKISLEKIKCNEETNEVGSDEPYVLVTAVDYSTTPPAFEVVRYGPFNDVDQGETHKVLPNSPVFWGLNNKEAQLTNSNDAVFIVALMENDDGDAETLRGIVKGIVASSVLGSLNFSRAERVSKLINDINSATGTPTGAPNFDDRVGKPKELRFTNQELLLAHSIFSIKKEMIFVGDGGVYTLTFEAQNPKSAIGNRSGFKIIQASSNRFFDAHTSAANDFSLVTRTAQNNNTQLWGLKLVGAVYTIQQKSNGRFIDAHVSSNNDFSVVTRTAQNNDTQRWVIMPSTNGTSTIQQLYNGRFIDAHTSAANDFSLVTRTAQNNDTQRWVIRNIGSNNYTIKQKSSNRFVDGHEASSHDFSVVTRTAQSNNTQRWILTQVGGVYTIRQKANGRYVDAHVSSNNDFSVVTRTAQNNDTQRWVIIPNINGTSTIQQLYNGRFVDAHVVSSKDFSIVTRTAQNNDTQRWIITI